MLPAAHLPQAPSARAPPPLPPPPPPPPPHPQELQAHLTPPPPPPPRASSAPWKPKSTSTTTAAGSAARISFFSAATSAPLRALLPAACSGGVPRRQRRGLGLCTTSSRSCLSPRAASDSHLAGAVAVVAEGAEGAAGWRRQQGPALTHTQEGTVGAAGGERQQAEPGLEGRRRNRALQLPEGEGEGKGLLHHGRQTESTAESATPRGVASDYSNVPRSSLIPDRSEEASSDDPYNGTSSSVTPQQPEQSQLQQQQQQQRDTVGGHGMSASSCPTPQPLTSSYLQSYIVQQGLRACIVPPALAYSPAAAALPPSQGVVKSIVLLADGEAVVVVVAGEDRLDERKVADLLQVARRRVRLARPDEVLLHTGYQVGTVPPFGHPRRLRTFVDLAATRLTRVYGGSGDPDREVSVAVPDLLSYCQAVVADVAARAAAAEPPPPLTAAAALRATSADLPLPWVAGSEMVRLVAVVAQRRRIAKLLQFVNLVPEQVPELPPDGTATYLRKLWRSPDTGTPVEVQLIMGKTLERNLGREQAQALMDQVKVGCIVVVTGRVQANPLASSGGPPRAATPPPAQTAASPPGAAPPAPPRAAPAAAAPAPPPPAPRQLRHDVLDVVCHSVAVLHKSKDHLNKALRAAKRSGLGSPSTASELLRLIGQPSPHPTAPDQAMNNADRVFDLDKATLLVGEDRGLSFAGGATSSSSRGSSGGEEGGAEREAVDDDGTAAVAVAGARTHGSVRGRSSQRSSRAAVAATAGAVQLQAPSAPLPDAGAAWRMPLPGGAVELVSTASAVRRMHREILLAAAPEPAAVVAAAAAPEPAVVSDGSASGVGAGAAAGAMAEAEVEVEAEARWCGADAAGSGTAVVALDCEWAPFDRHQPKTPVSILQVATRGKVYIVDLLRLLGGEVPPDGDGGGEGDEGGGAQGADATGTAAPADDAAVAAAEQSATTGGRGGCAAAVPPPAALSEGAVAVSAFLSNLLTSRQILKVGFQLASDMDRLCESYPHLPCFAPAPSYSHLTNELVLADSESDGPGPLDRYQHGTRYTAVNHARNSTDAANIDTPGARRRNSNGTSGGSGAHGDASDSCTRAQLSDSNGSSSGSGGSSGSSGSGSSSAPAVAAATSADPRVCHLCVDIVALARALRPDLVRTPQVSLSRLVALVLGKPLDKAQQRSDWARRPLTAEQMSYAATDAYCLVALYDAMLGLNGIAQTAAGSEVADEMRDLKDRAAKTIDALPAAVKRIPLANRVRC